MAKEPLRADVQAAVDRMSTKIGAGRELRKLPEHLAPGEQIEQLATALYGKGNGLLVLTDRRLLFLFEGLMSSTSEDFPFDRITSVQWSSGILFGSVIVHAGGQKAKVENVDKAAGRRIVDQVREHMAGVPAASRAVQAALGGAADELMKLSELHKSGILSDDEFTAAKTRLLS